MARHELDIASLLIGLVFLGVSIAVLFDSASFLALDSPFLWPLLLSVIGLAILTGGKPKKETSPPDKGQ